MILPGACILLSYASIFPSRHIGARTNMLLYGLSRDELRYVLDPQEVWLGFPLGRGAFRVLKEKEISSSESIGRGGSCWRSGMSGRMKDEG